MNLTIRDQPIFEDESQAKQAMDEMANTLRMVSTARCPNLLASRLTWYHTASPATWHQT